jgi:hypothetical protein
MNIDELVMHIHEQDMKLRCYEIFIIPCIADLVIFVRPLRIPGYIVNKLRVADFMHELAFETTITMWNIIPESMNFSIQANEIERRGRQLIYGFYWAVLSYGGITTDVQVTDVVGDELAQVCQAGGSSG